MLQCGKSKYKLKGNTDVFEKIYMMYSLLKNIAKKAIWKNILKPIKNKRLNKNFDLRLDFGIN